MKLKKVNSYVIIYSLLALVAVTAIMLGASETAIAQTTNLTPTNPDPPPSYNPGANPFIVFDLASGQICPGFFAGPNNFVAYAGLTGRFVLCIQDAVGWALQNYLGQFIGYFVGTVNALMALAATIYGFFVITGRAQPAGRQGVILLIQIGIIIFLINAGQFVNLFPFIISSIDYLVGLVTNYTALQLSPYCPFSPFIWDRLDCVLNLLIGGIFTTSSLTSGLIGFLLAMLFSTGIGVAFFFFGVGIILSCLLSILQAMFILISAYIAIALLSLIAPLVIPLILFKNTKAYFDK